jgi:hypothetical protein
VYREWTGFFERAGWLLRQTHTAFGGRVCLSCESERRDTHTPLSYRACVCVSTGRGSVRGRGAARLEGSGGDERRVSLDLRGPSRTRCA